MQDSVCTRVKFQCMHPLILKDWLIWIPMQYRDKERANCIYNDKCVGVGGRSGSKLLMSKAAATRKAFTLNKHGLAEQKNFNIWLIIKYNIGHGKLYKLC